MYLMQGEGANTESGQLHCVQQCGLDHPVCLRATTRPVLIALDLRGSKKSISLIGTAVLRRKATFFFSFMYAV